MIPTGPAPNVGLPDNYGVQIEKLRGRIAQLEAALHRIDGINDNPSNFNSRINDVIVAAIGLTVENTRKTGKDYSKSKWKA